MQLRQVVCLIFLASISCLKGQPPPCGAGEWRCFDGSCVAASKKCNGKSDCLDGSDEVDCRAGPSVLSACPPGQFACVGPPGCVPDSALCDGLRHCVSGSDEANCQGCLDSDWTCRNRMCVPKELRCDGNNDCLDNSDELSCGRCDPSGVQCPDGACLSPQERCDGKVQCSDGSDEPATCGHRCSESNGGCSHVCVDKPWGVLCTCPPGYKVAENGAVCQDIDECSLPYGSCLHYCINTMGSYYCHCRDGFTVQGSTGCKATGNPTRLLSVWKKSISLLSLKGQRLPVVQNLGTDPVALTFDLARGLYFWVDSQGSIHRTDMKQSITLYTESGITSLACDWLTGQLYWSNLKTQSICVGAANGSAYATLLKRNVSPYELVLLPSESSMFWIDRGPADRTTLEKARMDGSMRGSLVVLTTQDAICLTLDVGSRRLYWISVFKMSVETVKVDGSGRYSFLGIFSSRQALNLAVFDSQLYWSDEKGLWSASLDTPKQKTFILRTPPSILAVFHELQQPRGYSPCLNRPCLLCLPSVAHPASSSLGFSCICPDDRLLLPDGTCDYPRFAYATAKGVSLLEFKGSELLKTPIFSAQDDLLSFDVDWYRNWLYWANATGHVQRTGIAQIKTEDIPTLKAACIIKVDQRNGNLYWLSCDQFYIGATDINRGYSQQLYHAGNEVNDIYPDWLGGMLYWLEAGTVFTMRLLGGNTRKLFSVGGGVTGGLTLDWRANSLLWNTKDGLSTASLLQGKLHQDKRWKISGSVVAALEPFLLSLSGNTLTLWNRMDVRSVQKVTVESGVISVILAFKSVKPVSSTAKTCTSPSVLCPQSSLCISPSQLCDGQVDCPDGFDEQACVKTCPERGDFRCKDRRSCVTRSLLCDGRSHCLDGSDELNCPTVAAPTTQAAALKCRLGSRLCKNGRECVLYSHVCDGERDCQDGSDEQGCQQVCNTDEFQCGHGRSCIPRRQVCDGRAQCQDRSDELDCWTPTQDCQHRCDNKTRCIPESLLCDGERDCLDGTDEEDCVSTKPALDLSAQSTYKYSPPVQHLTPPPTTPACITPSVSCPQSSICISQSQMCDGQTDCPDGFDEQGCVTRCPNRADFRCKDRRSCVTRSLLCDGRSHCLDGSDELNCPTVAAPTTQAAALKCRLGSRLCKNGKECVLYSHVCDGERDCQDGSDEQECDVPLESSPTTVPLTTPACTSPSVLCPQSLVCISQSQMCDGQTDCPDGFDEQGCITRCPNRADFRCKDRRSCVTRSLLCDGRSHCLDGSDELNCPTVAAPTTQAAALKCRLGSRLCKNGMQCVLYSHVCDGERDCQDGSDEQECDVPLESSPTTVPLTTPACTSPSVLCPQSLVCISQSQMCDGQIDCPDGFDEQACVKTCPKKGDFRCKDRRSCVTRSLLCDGRSHCLDGSDELNCPTMAAPTTQAAALKCRLGSRLCKNGKECVLYSHVCDGERDCQDGSDEQGCQQVCKPDEFQCGHGMSCIPRRQVCDGRAQCQDRSDELDCWTPTHICQHRCDNRTRCIPETFLCDGERDCLDGTDEEDCDFVDEAPGPNMRSFVSSSSPPPPQPACIPPSVLCPQSLVCISQSQMCDGQTDCPDGFDERVCVNTCPYKADFRCKDRRSCVTRSLLCDGRSHCLDGSDELNCPTVAAPTTQAAALKCRLGSRLCKNGRECVLYSHVCDGERDCQDGSDEQECQQVCKPDEFQCGHGRSCIPREQLCDGRAQCQDRSDELDCWTPTQDCQHRCDNRTRCIPESFLCDGERDCLDRTDEEDCGVVSCARAQYRCASGQCVSEALRCDGHADCKDHSDETGCSKPPRCPPELRCARSHECLVKEWICDGEEDCPDGSDERNCQVTQMKCGQYQWRCASTHQCVPLSWRCDKQIDCEDWSDEAGCGKRKCPSHLFQCGSGECIDPSLVCSRVTNCPDRSDEGPGCALQNCTSPTAPRCGQHCISTPHGPRCGCKVGFSLASNGVLCVDVDECAITSPPVCSHSCLNTRGSYLCRCQPGYYLEPDMTSCKTTVEPLLLASVQSELLLLGVRSSSLRLLTASTRPVFTLDYHWLQSRVYWLSPEHQSIMWTATDDSQRLGRLVKGVKTDSIAVDWVGRNLYWVDGLAGQILAVRLGNATVSPQNYTVVLDEDLEQPHSLVLLPDRGLMLWSEIGSDPQIERSGMDGSRRKVLVSRSLNWPVSLAVDLLADRFYWTDERMHCIGSASLEGDDIRLLQLTETPSPFSIAVFDDKVYWSDTRRRTIQSANKITGKDRKVLLKRPGQPFGLRLMHPLAQADISSPCDRLKCSHLCLLAPGAGLARAVRGPAAVCRCPAGLLLSGDGVTCSLPVDSTFLLLLAPTTITQIYLRTLRKGVGLKKWPEHSVLPLPGVVDASGLDAAIQAKALYVADAGQSSVGLLKLTSQGLSPAGRILKLQDDSVTALAVDWVTANLYWSSSLHPDLHVTSSPDGYTVPLLQGSLQGTTSIAVHPPSGRLCFTAVGTEKGESLPQVDCCYMDGRRHALLWRKSRMPTSLVFSSQGTVLYWADMDGGVVSSISVDGTGYKEFKAGPGLLVSVSRTENMLLWVTTDKGISQLWVSDDFQPKQLWFEVNVNVVALRAYSKASQKGVNACSNRNGECDQLCLAFPGGRTCRCGRDFHPVNMTSCSPSIQCPEESGACWDGSTCLLSAKFCDGRFDCPDQSDEQDCPYSNVASNGAKPKGGRPPSPSDTPEAAGPRDGLSDSQLCDQQQCSRHGACEVDGGVARCRCHAGYHGVSCQKKGSGGVRVFLTLGLICLIIGLVIAAVVLWKRRVRAARGRSTEKETLMTDMETTKVYTESFANDLYDPDDQVHPDDQEVAFSADSSTQPL